MNLKKKNSVVMTEVDVIEHKWEYCELCEHDVVICGKCGNNTCNGGHGKVDGKECDACESAYAVYLNIKNDKFSVT